jgi:flavin-binding protein dodecin
MYNIYHNIDYAQFDVGLGSASGRPAISGALPADRVKPSGGIPAFPSFIRSATQWHPSGTHSHAESIMNDHVYKTVEITGSSSKSADDAIRIAIDKASDSISNMRWFKVIETRGNLEDGKIAYWQVTLHIGFTVQ